MYTAYDRIRRTLALIMAVMMLCTAIDFGAIAESLNEESAPVTQSESVQVEAPAKEAAEPEKTEPAKTEASAAEKEVTKFETSKSN